MKRQAAERIEFSGRFTVHTAAGERRRLLAILDSGRDVTLVLREVEAADVSFFQLLCALHRSAMRAGLKVRVEPPVSARLKDLMAGLGFDRRTSCTDEDDDCIWKTIDAVKDAGSAT